MNSLKLIGRSQPSHLLILLIVVCHDAWVTESITLTTCWDAIVGAVASLSTCSRSFVALILLLASHGTEKSKAFAR